MVACEHLFGEIEYCVNLFSGTFSFSSVFGGHPILPYEECLCIMVLRPR